MLQCKNCVTSGPTARNNFVTTKLSATTAKTHVQYSNHLGMKHNTQYTVNLCKFQTISIVSEHLWTSPSLSPGKYLELPAKSLCAFSVKFSRDPGTAWETFGLECHISSVISPRYILLSIPVLYHVVSKYQLLSIHLQHA